MNAIARSNPVDVGVLDLMSTAELKAELANVLTITASSLVRAAAIVRVIESRGESLAQFKSGLIGYLRKIAHGQLLPEVVAVFVGHPALKRIAQLPEPDQRRCLESDGLPIGVMLNGQVDQRMKPILQMEQFEVRQVFADDHIRSPEEQLAWLKSQELRRPQFDHEIEVAPYTISGNSILVTRPVRLTKKVLENILRGMK